MKKIVAFFAAGLIIASAVPVLAADSDTANRDFGRPGYCWQASDDQANDGNYYGGCRRYRGHGGCYWDNNRNDR